MFVEYSAFVSNIIAFLPFLLPGGSAVTVHFHGITARTAWQLWLSHPPGRLGAHS